MSTWACNDGMSDDELTYDNRTVSSPSPIISPDNFYTDGCGDRPYDDFRQRATKESPPPVVEINEPQNTVLNYPQRNYQYYNDPRIIVDYSSRLESVRESGSNRDYISSRDVFTNISLGGRLPRDLMRTLDCSISDRIFESFNGTEQELKEFTNFYWKQEETSVVYKTNLVASPYKGLMFLTRNYDIILGECTKAFLKYNDQVIY